MTTLTIITPCFNEYENIENCISQVKKIMDRYGPEISYEHIVSDNHSQDKTLEILLSLRKENPHIRILKNSRNIGPVLNIWSALNFAKGEYVIPFLPADLQDPVEIIPKFFELINNDQELDTVFGIRKNRRESFFLRKSRDIYYKVIVSSSGQNLPEHAGEFLITRRHVIESILHTNQEYPFIRGLIALTSTKTSTIEYDWATRKKGKSKNNFWSLLDEALNGFVSVSRIPARFAIICGFIMSVFGIIFAFVNVLTAFFSQNNVGKGIPTIIVGLFLFSGVQLAFLGLIGEYILSIHRQIKKSPKHLVIEV